MQHRFDRRFLAVPVAILACLLAVSPTLGAGWYPRVALSTHSNGEPGGLVTLNDTTAVAAYVDSGQVFARRTTNSGATWQPPVLVAGKTSAFVAISGRGSDVDVVWQRGKGLSVSIRYAHSANGGISFSAPLEIAVLPILGAASVGRGADGLVAVAWNDSSSDQVKVRISTNGGASFGSVRAIGTSTYTFDLPPAVAISSGVIYVVYFTDATHIELRRAQVSGAKFSWMRAQQIADDASFGASALAVSISAERSSAFIAYAAQDGADTWIRYTRTGDLGASWEPIADLSPQSIGSDTPVINLKDGVARVAYHSCKTPTCAEGTFAAYRESTDGTTWSAVEAASHSSAAWAVPAGVGWAGRTMVLYSADHVHGVHDVNADMYLRSR